MSSVHIARIGLLPVSSTGAVLSKATATIGQIANASSESRVLYDATYAPNASAYPTVEAYITAEEAAGYQLTHLSQTFIVTRKP